ncbi:MAG: B12-binding domain-containing protein [Candidatus Hodarchaeota archaeon]
MSSKEEILDKLSEAVINGNNDMTVEFSKKALEACIDPLEAINKGLKKAISVVSEKYEKQEIRAPEVLVAGDAMKASLEVLKPVIKEEQVTELKKILIDIINLCETCGIKIALKI